jgi:hypothetical protein
MIIGFFGGEVRKKRGEGGGVGKEKKKRKEKKIMVVLGGRRFGVLAFLDERFLVRIFECEARERAGFQSFLRCVLLPLDVVRLTRLKNGMNPWRG